MNRVPLTVRARWLWSPQQPLRSGPFVTLDAHQILSVERSCDGPYVDLGNHLLLPGFVNPHTHLEFSQLTQPLGAPGMPFTDWLKQVVGGRGQVTAADKAEAVAQGAQLLQQAGTVALGEIATSPWHAPRESAGLLEMLAFHEWISLNPDREPQLLTGWQTLEQQLQPASAQADVQPASENRQWHLGLSPHAPYSVHPQLFERICQRAQQSQQPLAMHLAETREELDLLQTGQGPFREFLESLGVYREDAFAVPRDMQWYFERLAAAPRCLMIHGNYLSRANVAWLAQHRDRCSVIYCPRTHSYFAHDPYPLSEYLAAGVHVALGTDSLASTPTLSSWDEFLAACRKHADVPPAEMLRLICDTAARSLGWEDRYGRIAASYSSHLNLVPLDGFSADSSDELLARVVAHSPRVRPVAFWQITQDFPAVGR